MGDSKYIVTATLLTRVDAIAFGQDAVIKSAKRQAAEKADYKTLDDDTPTIRHSWGVGHKFRYVSGTPCDANSEQTIDIVAVNCTLSLDDFGAPPEYQHFAISGGTRMATCKVLSCKVAAPLEESLN